MSTGRPLVLHKGIPKMHWGEAIMTSVNLTNHIPSRNLEYLNPLIWNIWNKFSRLFSHVQLKTDRLPRTFGCVAYVRQQSTSISKFDSRSIICLFMAHSSIKKGYRYHHPAWRRFFGLQVRLLMRLKCSMEGIPRNQGNHTLGQAN